MRESVYDWTMVERNRIGVTVERETPKPAPPPAAKSVTITLSESDAKLLKRIAGYDITIPETVEIYDATRRRAIAEFLGALSRTLFDAGIKS